MNSTFKKFLFSFIPNYLSSLILTFGGIGLLVFIVRSYGCAQPEFPDLLILSPHFFLQKHIPSLLIGLITFSYLVYTKILSQKAFILSTILNITVLTFQLGNHIIFSHFNGKVVLFFYLFPLFILNSLLILYLIIGWIKRQNTTENSFIDTK